MTTRKGEKTLESNLLCSKISLWAPSFIAEETDDFVRPDRNDWTVTASFAARPARHRSPHPRRKRPCKLVNTTSPVRPAMLPSQGRQLLLLRRVRHGRRCCFFIERPGRARCSVANLDQARAERRRQVICVDLQDNGRTPLGDRDSAWSTWRRQAGVLNKLRTKTGRLLVFDGWRRRRSSSRLSIRRWFRAAWPWFPPHSQDGFYPEMPARQQAGTRRRDG